MELLFDLAVLLLAMCPKNPKSPVLKNLCSLMFIVVGFTVAKCWKEPKCHQQMNGSDNCGAFIQWNTTSRKKEGNSTFCNSMVGTGEYYVK